MITPDQLRDWAQDADDGEDVALDGDTLREIAQRMRALAGCSEDLINVLAEHNIESGAAIGVQGYLDQLPEGYTD